MQSVQLTVEKGPQTGKVYAVSAAGVRIGRVSKNDIVIDDPLVSRFHCRIFSKDDESLWISDLGSSNQTLVNDKPAQEMRLSPGDSITVGDTLLRLQFAEANAAVEAVPPPAVDLGLSTDQSSSAGLRLPKMSLVVVGTLLVVLLGWLFLVKFTPERKPAKRPTTPPPPKDVEVYYEKVQATTDRVFRYDLSIAPDGKIAVVIDDTEKTHVREEADVDEALLQDLADFIQQAGFFALSEDFTGIAAESVLESSEISVVLGRRAHRVRVVNRVEPEEFKKVREKLEEFGKIELGIWAVQYAPEKLLEMAREAYLLGQKMYEEREIAYGNLARAIRSYKDADFCLRTVEPKPDFYPEVLSGIAVCREELDKRYENQNFLATRAMNLKSWDEAARELRVLLDLIPESSDPRNQEARRKLLEVENRLKKRK